MSRTKIKHDKRVKVFTKSQGRCAYCGVELEFNTYTVDHILPLAWGGSNQIENMVAACHPCNSQKKSSTVKEFRTKKKVDRFWIEEVEGTELKGHSAVVWKVIGGGK